MSTLLVHTAAVLNALMDLSWLLMTPVLVMFVCELNYNDNIQSFPVSFSIAVSLLLALAESLFTKQLKEGSGFSTKGDLLLRQNRKKKCSNFVFIVFKEIYELNIISFKIPTSGRQTSITEEHDFQA